MLTRNLEQTLHRALSLASERRHEYATLEPLLLGLADDTDAATVLRACGVDLEAWPIGPLAVRRAHVRASPNREQ
jgi:ATP-dependent Clp protease ATP-binding subunit ClpA